MSTVVNISLLLYLCFVLLLRFCYHLLVNKDLYNISMCIRFGRRFTAQCAELVNASGGRLRWVDRCRYLGVYFTIAAAHSDAVSRMLNLVSIGRLTPFSVKLVVALLNLLFWVCCAVNVCLSYCMHLKQVHYWPDKFSQLKGSIQKPYNGVYMVFALNICNERYSLSRTSCIKDKPFRAKMRKLASA